MSKIWVLVALVGCMHHADLGPHELCAQNSLLLESTATANNQSSGHVGLLRIHHDDDEASMSCRRPATVEEQCEVEGYVASARYKARHPADEVEDAYDRATRVFVRVKRECLRRERQPMQTNQPRPGPADNAELDTP